MRRFSRPKVIAKGVQLVLNLVVCCMVLTMVAMPASVTQRGTQCPTAPVQTIVTPKGARAPKIGEKGFQQCQCAEKRSMKSQTEMQGVISIEATLPPARRTPWIPQTIVQDVHCEPIFYLTEGYITLETPPPQA